MTIVNYKKAIAEKIDYWTKRLADQASVAANNAVREKRQVLLHEPIENILANRRRPDSGKTDTKQSVPSKSALDCSQFHKELSAALDCRLEDLISSEELHDLIKKFVRDHDKDAETMIHAIKAAIAACRKDELIMANGGFDTTVREQAKTMPIDKFRNAVTDLIGSWTNNFCGQIAFTIERENKAKRHISLEMPLEEIEAKREEVKMASAGNQLFRDSVYAQLPEEMDYPEELGWVFTTDVDRKFEPTFPDFPERLAVVLNSGLENLISAKELSALIFRYVRKKEKDAKFLMGAIEAAKAIRDMAAIVASDGASYAETDDDAEDDSGNGSNGSDETDSFPDNSGDQPSGPKRPCPPPSPLPARQIDDHMGDHQ